MQTNVREERAVRVTFTAAQVGIVASAVTVALLAALHILSPEFDPSWRVISEYALGQHGWALALMFVSWAIATWSVALALRPLVETRAARVGLALLGVAGVGQVLAAVFSIGHPMHDVAGALGTLGFTVGATIVSVSLARRMPKGSARRALLWTAHSTWISNVLMALGLAVLIAQVTRAGIDVSTPPETLPDGIVAFVGYANRLLVLAYCAWLIAASRLVLQRGAK